jgi:hypothetical protein
MPVAPVARAPVAPVARIPAAPIAAPRVEPAVETQADIGQLAAPAAAPAPRSYAAPSRDEEYEPEPEQIGRMSKVVGGKPLWFWVAIVAGVWILGMIIAAILKPVDRGRDYDQRMREKQQQSQKATPPANSNSNTK